ncbi:HAMP domain-containing methyl-accepting chemotaxis protein [Novosphingobium sp. MW5]|nr:HAMP domain-containing methyl-accepting chemotaxis protein [Novosphingobium sp. MW5]
MNISKKTKVGGIAFVALIAVSIAVTTFSINRIRMGGALDNEDRLISDLVADTMPPPIYIIEPWLEVSLIADQHGSTAEHLAKLDVLHKEFTSRKKHWLSQDIPADLKTKTAAAVDEADKFWNIYNASFLPAVRANDMVAFEKAHDALGAVYDEHHAHIEALVTATRDHQAKLLAADESIVDWTIALLGLIAVLLAAGASAAAWAILKFIVKPVDETADTMRSMAEGQLDAGRRSEHRDDEIGTMTRALEVFRESAIAQRDAQEHQRKVVDALSSGLGELAAGNLTHRIETPLAPEYEALRDSFNNTIAELRTLIQRINGSAQSVATGAGEIRAASDDLALRNEQQAASLEETAAAMNQVTGIVNGTAKGAGDVQRSINEAHREASEGGDVVIRAVDAMAAIEKSSEEISQIINVIDGIAFQTNLLALNAGVEAARAGDAGKGFAVVANEVRALAQRSADAAKDIKELITASTEQVAGGVKLVGETGDLLSKIVGRVGEINTMVAEIAASTEHQATSLQQVNSAVSEMDRMTQQNAAMVEESTAAARSLADEASELTRVVSQFRTGLPASSKPIAHLAAKAPVRTRRVPAVSGNLALASSPSDDDWTEF